MRRTISPGQWLRDTWARQRQETVCVGQEGRDQEHDCLSLVSSHEDFTNFKLKTLEGEAPTLWLSSPQGLRRWTNFSCCLQWTKQLHPAHASSQFTRNSDHLFPEELSEFECHGSSHLLCLKIFFQ